MRLCVLDFETFFDADYSLSRMTTESYVRDPRFHAHLFGYFWPDSMERPEDCLSVALDPVRGNQELRRDLERSAIIAHHAHFEALILAHHFGIRPAFWFDTLSMARLVLPRLQSHSLDALAQHFGLPAKNVPYNLFKGVQALRGELYEQVADGCLHDVNLTWVIFQKLLRGDY